MAHATCEGKPPVRPLPVLARHLRFGLRDVQDLVEAPVTLGGLPGATQRFRATLDGVPVAVRAVTLQGAGCVYDLVGVAPPDGTLGACPGFRALLGGLRPRRAPHRDRRLAARRLPRAARRGVLGRPRAPHLGGRSGTRWLPRRYVPLVVAEFDGMGVRSLVVAGTAAIFTGMVFALQSSVYLSRFGADLYVGPLVGLSVLRELGPVLTAILVGGQGRLGDHGRARLDEGDGADRRAPGDRRELRQAPDRAPRVIAALLVFPLLTALADFIALVGGMLIAVYERRIDVYLYWNTIFYWVVIRDLVTGVGKSFFFGVIVTLIGAHNGLAMTGGTEGLGRATTATVVQVSMAVIIADFFLTKLFLLL